MHITFRKIFYWGLGCAKRGIILAFPMFGVAMELIDILTIANAYYPDNLSAFIFGLLGIFFYISCLYCILVPFNTWNKRLLIISLCLLLGMCKLDPNIRKMFQYSHCIEVSSVPCPDGIVLGGGQAIKALIYDKSPLTRAFAFPVL